MKRRSYWSMKSNWIAKSVKQVLLYLRDILSLGPLQMEVDGGLVEMKRIFTDGLSLKEAVCKRRICRDTCHGLVINRNHKFYYQVQQLMLCTKSFWTDLVLSDTVNLIILHVRKDKKFLSDIVPKLEKFYDNHISLELAYPRVYDGLTRLSKLIN